MKDKYTKKELEEAIKHWSNELDKIEEKEKLEDNAIEECDGGGMAAGGDAGGPSAGAAAAGGDFTTATSTEDVLGKFDPSKGVLGVKDYHIPAKVKVPFTRLAGNGGGSVRKKDKNGKPKSYYPEKGMKVVDYTKESIDESYDWMIEEAASLKRGKTVEVKNDIQHCKTKEKANLEKVSLMKKTNEKPSNATSEKIKKIKNLKLSKAELKDLEKCGSIATMQFDEDADNLCLGDILNVGNVHCKVASKRWLKDVNEHPFKDLLPAKDLEACKSAKKIALVVLLKMQ